MKAHIVPTNPADYAYDLEGDAVMFVNDGTHGYPERLVPNTSGDGQEAVFINIARVQSVKVTF